MKTMYCVLLSIAAVLFLHCGTTQSIVLPEGFARYEKPKKDVKAITADGVRLFTSRFENKPKGDLSLWVESLSEQLTQTGYRVVDKKSIKAGSLEGVAIESHASYAGQDFSYLVAVFVKDDNVFTVESTGERKAFDKIKPALFQSLTTFKGE